MEEISGTNQGNDIRDGTHPPSLYDPPDPAKDQKTSGMKGVPATSSTNTGIVAVSTKDVGNTVYNEAKLASN